ncbi:MAG: hypothetical protein IAF58_01435 [Leptolyngbya sp.]|nr:hypothetical protein [Candidatus Melainabacteria bacterium]
MSPKNALNAVLIVLALVGSGVALRACNYASETASVVEREVAPAVLLQRYNRFKDTLASLDAIKADIKVYQATRDAIKAGQVDENGKSIPQGQWPQDVRFDYGQSQKEIAGKISAYNKLAGEYNADMSKAQFAFTNVGSLPKGATEALPRAVRDYVDTIN